jgi:chromate transport protein ChrA
MVRASTLIRGQPRLVFTTLLVVGVTTSSPHRNGWTTFVVLCIGGITPMFLVGAASLWVLRNWSRWGALGKVLSGVGILVLGVVVMLSYEMHWAAIRSLSSSLPLPDARSGRID